MALTRRSFISATALGAGALSMNSLATGEVDTKTIAGFGDKKTEVDAAKAWRPVSDRKIKMGLVGYGLCKFAADFSLQNHPNVEIVAVSDLIPERCQGLAAAARCTKTYPSLEELVKDDRIEAVYVATDAAGHAAHAIEVLKHGKHVAVAVPAVLGDLEDADRLYEAVKESGLIYMMFETSVYRDNCYAMRKIHERGGFGKLIYIEGEYYHYYGTPLPSFKGWRTGLPPQFYPTHATAYYIGVTNHCFTEVSCQGHRGIVPAYQPENNVYKNPFGTEIALFRTEEGGTARMIIARDIQGHSVETGRCFGEKGSYTDKFNGCEEAANLVARLSLKKPALPPNVKPGGHGGSHGYLGNEFVESILENRRPLVDISKALNMTVPGIIAHHSALKDGETLKVPKYEPVTSPS